MKFLQLFISAILLLTMLGLEVSRSIDLPLTIEEAETSLMKDIVEEDNSEEENKRTEEKIKICEDEFRYCSLLRERPYLTIITTHDLNYRLPDFEAVFSPPEYRFS